MGTTTPTPNAGDIFDEIGAARSEGDIFDEISATPKQDVFDEVASSPALQNAAPSGTGYPKPAVPGNIQWRNRQNVPMPGQPGSYGTVYSASRNEDGLEVLYPRIYDGALHSDDEAWQRYKQTGRHMGKFRSVADANAYAQKYHNDAAKGLYGPTPAMADTAFDRATSLPLTTPSAPAQPSLTLGAPPNRKSASEPGVIASGKEAEREEQLGGGRFVPPANTAASFLRPRRLQPLTPSPAPQVSLSPVARERIAPEYDPLSPKFKGSLPGSFEGKPANMYEGASIPVRGAEDIADLIRSQAASLDPETTSTPGLARAYKNVVAPAGEKSAEFVGAMVRPENIALMGALSALPAVTPAARALHTAIRAYFAGTMGLSGVEGAYRSYEAEQQGNVPEAVRQGIGAAFDLGMAGGMVLGPGKGYTALPQEETPRARELFRNLIYRAGGSLPKDFTPDQAAREFRKAAQNYRDPANPQNDIEAFKDLSAAYRAYRGSIIEPTPTPEQARTAEAEQAVNTLLPSIAGSPQANAAAEAATRPVPVITPSEVPKAALSARPSTSLTVPTGAAAPQPTTKTIATPSRAPQPPATPQPKPAQQGAEPSDRYAQAVELVRQHGSASAPMLQHRLRIGYGEAVRLVDRMTAEGLVAPASAPNPRTWIGRSTAAPKQVPTATPEPAQPSPAAERAGTTEVAARDTALYQQARAELGPKASDSQVAQRAQEMKTSSIAPAASVAQPAANTNAPAPAAKAPRYKYGNTQAVIAPESEAGQALESARQRISDFDLAGDGKDVGGNHVTVRYGVKGGDTAKIKQYLEQQAPFEATLGKTDSFPPSEHSDGAAPLIAPVEAPELHRIEKEIDAHGDFAERSFPEYRPHATLAYVRPDAAARYKGMTVTEGKRFTVDRIAITDRNGNEELVQLKGNGQAAPEIVWDEPAPELPGREAENLPGRPDPTVRWIPVEQMTVSPRDMQWRTKPRRSALDDVTRPEQWNNDLADMVEVWRNPDTGKILVEDGHHRYNKAVELGRDEIRAHVDTASRTLPEARLRGALLNIARGSGEPIDVARFLRDTGLSVSDLAQKSGVPVGGPLAEQGQALANLVPPLWDEYLQGTLPENMAVAIGKYAGGREQQKPILDYIRRKKMTAAQVPIVAARVAASGTTNEEVGTLFGVDQRTRSNFDNEVRFASRYADRLKSAKTTLRAAARQKFADIIASRSVGIVNPEKADSERMVAEALAERFDNESQQAGPVSDIIAEAGRRLTAGEKPDAVDKELFPKLDAALTESVAQVLGRATGTDRQERAGIAGTQRPAEAGQQEQTPTVEPPDRTLHRTATPAYELADQAADAVMQRPEIVRQLRDTMSAKRLRGDSEAALELLAAGGGERMFGRHPSDGAVREQVKVILQRHADIEEQLYPQALVRAVLDTVPKHVLDRYVKAEQDELVNGEDLFWRDESRALMRPAPPFYSKAIQVAEQKLPNWTLDTAVIPTLKNAGVKEDELKWMGLQEWLDQQKGKVTKTDVLGFLRANELAVREVVKGEALRGDVAARQLMAETRLKESEEILREVLAPFTDSQREHDSQIDTILSELRSGVRSAAEVLDLTDDPGAGDAAESYVRDWREYETIANQVEPTVYEQWQLPGGKNYREMFVTAPEVTPAWRDGHGGYADVLNPVVRIRFNDRASADGKRTLFLEEVQPPVQSQPMPAELRGMAYDVGLKRMIRWAAENGYDQVAWTTGDQQAERYDLSKQIETIRYARRHGGTYDLGFDVKNRIMLGRDVPAQYGVPESELDHYVGKEIAAKIIAGEGSRNPEYPDAKELSGLDLKVGGEGLKRAYDEMIPRILGKFGKKWGAKVGTTTIGAPSRDIAHKRFALLNRDNEIAGQYETRAEAERAAKYRNDKQQGMYPFTVQDSFPESDVKVHSFPITESMKKSVIEEGQPLFRPTTYSRKPADLKAAIEQVKNADAWYWKPEGGRPARIALNWDGITAVSWAKQHSILGLNTDLKGAEEIAGRLDTAAANTYDINRRASLRLSSIADLIRDAVKDAKPEQGVILFDTSLPMVEAEETLHAGQREAGAGDFRAGVPYEEMAQHPAFVAMERRIRNEHGSQVEADGDFWPVRMVAEAWPNLLNDEAPEFPGNTSKDAIRAYVEAGHRKGGEKWLDDTARSVQGTRAVWADYVGVELPRGIEHAERAIEEVRNDAARSEAGAAQTDGGRNPGRGNATVRGKAGANQRPPQEGLSRPAAQSLSDRALESWVRSAKSIRAELAGEQNDLFGAPEKVYKLTRTDAQGNTESQLATETQYRQLENFAPFRRALNAGNQQALFGTEAAGEILGGEARNAIELPPQESENQGTLFRPGDEREQEPITFGLTVPGVAQVAASVERAAQPVKDWLGDKVERVREAKEINDGLADLQGQYQADLLRMVQTMKEAPGTAADQEAIYHHLENPAEPLTGEQESMLDDWVRPFMDEAQRIYTKLTEGGVPVDNYVHRVVKDKGSLIDRVLGGSKGTGQGNVLSKYAPATKGRTMMALQADNVGGRRVTVSVKGDRVTMFDRGLPTDLGGFRTGMTTRMELIEPALGKIADRIIELESELKQLPRPYSRPDATRARKIAEELTVLRNQRARILESVPTDKLLDKVWIDKNGKRWLIKQATTKEIERNTDIRYYHNALASAITNYLNMRKAERAYDYIEALKSSPQFAAIAVQQGAGTPPAGWRPTFLPQFRGYFLESHVADVLDRYAQQLGRVPSVWDKVGQFLRTSIFFNPLIHVPNITVHWVVEKGVTGWLPWEWRKMGRAAVKAINAVTKQNDDYLEALDTGAPMQFQRFQNKHFADLFFKRMSDELERDPTVAEKVAKALGYANPVNLIRAIYNVSGKVTWWTNDVAFLQATYEKVAEGIPLSEALKETAKHIPDYRLPAHVLGSRTIAKLMENPNLTMFSHSHYGALRSYGEMLKDAMFEPNVDRKTRAHAWDVMAMLALMTLVIYPFADELLRKATGDKNARLRRAGAATFPYNLYLLARGERNAVETAQSVFTPAVHTKAGVELAFNRDLRTGRQIYDPHADWRTIADQIARNSLGESIAPISQATRIQEDKDALRRFGYGLAGVSFPLHGAEKVAQDIAISKVGTQAESSEHRRERLARRKAVEEGRKGNWEPLREGLRDGLIHRDQVHQIEREARMDPLVARVQNFTYPEAMRVFEAATPEQKRLLRPIILKKRHNLLLKGRPVDDEPLGANP